MDNTLTLDLISVDRLIPDPKNPRESYPKASIKELAHSIAQLGQLEAIRVNPVAGGNFGVEFGHRRYHAIALINEDPKSVGYKGSLPFLVRAEVGEKGGDLDVLLRQIAENGQREDLNPIEEARSYQRAIEEFGITQSDLADRISKNKSHVSKRLSLLRLPDAIHKLLLEERVTIEVAVEMAKLDNPTDDLADLISEIKEGYRPETEEVVEVVRRALELQQRGEALLIFAKAIEAKGHTVVSYMDARSKAEKNEVITVGAEFDPKKIPAKLPAGAVGVEVINPERARVLLVKPASEANPANIEMTEADRKAAASGDVAAQEKAAAAEKAKKQQERINRAKVREERVHRLGFLSTVAAKSKLSDVGMLAMRYIVARDITQQNRQRVAEVLGLDPVERTEAVMEWKAGRNVDTGKTRNVKDWDKAIDAFLEAGGDRAVVKAAMATMIANGESVLAERSPGFEINSWGKDWGYAMHLGTFPWEELAEEQPLPDPELFDGNDADAKPAKAPAAKKAPAKKASAPKKAAAAKKATPLKL